MSISKDEIAAMLRLGEDAQRAVEANQRQITAILKAAEQVRDLVNSPTLRQMQEVSNQDRIMRQFEMVRAKAVNDAIASLEMYPPESVRRYISAQSEVLNDTLVNHAALDDLRRATGYFKSCEIPNYARELQQLAAMSHASEKVLQTLSVRHGFADLLGVSDFTRSQIRYQTSRLNRAYAEYGASIASRPISTESTLPLTAPADAVYSQSRFVRVVSTHDDVEDENELSELWNDVGDSTLPYIDAVLPELNPKFMDAWRGVGHTAHRRGPDWLRQAAVSLRFIFVGVLDAVAPVDIINDSPQQCIPKRKKRKQKRRLLQISWLCDSLQNQTSRDVARADLEGALSIIDAMSEAVHRDHCADVEDAFDTMVVRAAVALRNLLRIWKGRNRT